MNRRTVSAVRKFKDGEGNYIWSPAGQPGQTSSLLGYPVTEIETMPDVAANSFSVAFGDFAKGYLIVDRAGVQVPRAIRIPPSPMCFSTPPNASAAGCRTSTPSSF